MTASQYVEWRQRWPDVIVRKNTAAAAALLQRYYKTNDAGVPAYSGAHFEDEDEYWAKPWHWEPEHAMWVEAGSPQCPQSGAPPDVAWQRFVRKPAQQQ